MLFAALLLLSPIPLIGDLALPVTNPASILAVNATNSSAVLPAETLIIPAISSTVAPASGRTNAKIAQQRILFVQFLLRLRQFQQQY